MPSILHLRSLAPFAPTEATHYEVARSGSSGGVSSILVVGLAILGVLLLLLAIGATYHFVKRRRARDAENNGTSDSQTHRAEKAAPQYGFSRANINSAIIMPRAVIVSEAPDYTLQNRRAMTEQEAAVVERHQANNELPAAFAAFVISDDDSEPHQFPISAEEPNAQGQSDWSTHQSKPSTTSTYTLTVSVGRTGTGEYRSSRASVASMIPSPLNESFNRQQSDISPPGGLGSPGRPIVPSRPSSLVPSDERSGSVASLRPGTAQSGGSHARGGPGSLSSFRFPNFPGDALPSPRYLHQKNLSVASVASTQSAFIFAHNKLSAMRKKALQAFEPLLPDELPVSVGDMFSLLQQFDDGWCVVAVESAELESSTGVMNPSKEIKMGCIPLWVFERKSNVPSENMRSMRSTSLAVTIEVTPDGPPGGLDAAPGRAPWSRDPIISWSNF